MNLTHQQIEIIVNALLQADAAIAKAYNGTSLNSIADALKIFKIVDSGFEEIKKKGTEHEIN